ncbi:hypothetical protein Hanom_Chr06g00487721 [Helianthus anomalus]
MGSPSEESFTEIYRRYFSPDEDAAEEEAVTSACLGDSVEHAWAIRPIRSNNDHDEDSEEEVGEEFEDGNFEDVGLDAGENEEEEGENEDDTEE